MRKVDRILRYLRANGYNPEALAELNSKELYRIFILTLALNSNLLEVDD